MANVGFGETLCFDDTNFALLGHPSVPLLSTALAATEAETASGRRLLSFSRTSSASRSIVALGTRAEPGPLYAGLARDLVDRHVGCAAAAARIMKGARRRANAPRARHRRLSRLRAQGELRLDDQAVPRRPRRAKRDPRGTARARGHDRLQNRARGPSGLRRGSSAGRSRASITPSRHSGCTWHPSAPGSRSSPIRRARSPTRPSTRSSICAAEHRGLKPGRRRRPPRVGVDECRPGRAGVTRGADHRARAQVLDAVLRRGRAGRGGRVDFVLVHGRRGPPAADTRELMESRHDGGRPGGSPQGAEQARVESVNAHASRRAHVIDPGARRAGAPGYAVIRCGAAREVPGPARVDRPSRSDEADGVRRGDRATSRTSRTSAR